MFWGKEGGVGGGGQANSKGASEEEEEAEHSSCVCQTGGQGDTLRREHWRGPKHTAASRDIR